MITSLWVPGAPLAINVSSLDTAIAAFNAAVAPATAATYAGVLYSIARGDKARVTTVTSAPFDG